MCGQRLALGFALRRRGRVGQRRAGDHAPGVRVLGFQVLQRQLQLVSELRQALGRLAELHAPQTGELHLQLLDLERGQLERVLRPLEVGTGPLSRAGVAAAASAIRP